MQKKMLVFLLLCTLAFVPMKRVTGYVTGPVLYSAWTTSPPTIDGGTGPDPPDEWADANRYDIIYSDDGLYGGFWESATLWIKNDGDFLYLMWNKTDIDTVGTLWDQYVGFDVDNDGVLEYSEEDGKVAYNGALGGEIVKDYYWDGAWLLDIDAGGTDDGEQATNGPIPLYREMIIPLSSGDMYDIDVSAGDTVGFFLQAWSGPVEEWGFGDIYYWWPEDANGEDATTWGQLVLASPPGPPPAPVPEFGFNVPMITSIAAATYLFLKQRLFKRRE